MNCFFVFIFFLFLFLLFFFNDTATTEIYTLSLHDALPIYGRVAVAAESGLFLSDSDGGWKALFPRDDKRSWAPYDVRGVAFDSEDRLWFASSQGVGVGDGKEWKIGRAHV